MVKTRKGSVDRKIFFYRIKSASNDAVARGDIVKAVEEINSLPWIDGGNYMVIADGHDVCMWCDQIHPQIRLKMAIKRKNALPDIEKDGIRKPLNLEEQEGLLEITHLIIYPSGVIGMEFNFYGPRIHRLEQYLNIKTSLSTVKIKMLLQHDAEEMLKKFRNISLLHFRLKKDDINALKVSDEGGLSQLFVEQMEQIQVPLFEIVLRNAIFSKTPLSNRIFDFAKKLAGATKTKESLDILKIKGYNETTYRHEDLDLLGDKLISTQRVIKQSARSRCVDSGSVYEAINNAHSQLIKEINSAAEIENEF